MAFCQLSGEETCLTHVKIETFETPKTLEMK